MKLLVIALVLAACGGEKKVDLAKWADVETAAAPLVPAADGALLAKSLEGVTDSDITEVALDDAIAWRKANGGLPWRAAMTMGDPRLLKAARLGKALVERRPDDPDAASAALYLAHRMRAEGHSMLECFIGFDLAKQVGKKPADAALAPTEAEIRRAVATDALQFMTMLKDVPKEPKPVDDDVRRVYIRLVVDAPAERAAYFKHVETEVAKAQKDDVMSMIISPKLPSLLREMYATLDAWR